MRKNEAEKYKTKIYIKNNIERGDRKRNRINTDKRNGKKNTKGVERGEWKERRDRE